MTPKKTREKKVMEWVELWQSRWLLNHWDLTINFCEDRNKPDNDNCWASCSANTKYLYAEIDIWRPFWLDSNSDAQRSDVIAHELAHILTWELAALVARVQNGLMVTQTELNHTDEVTTEHLAKALTRAYRT